ncbi:MAG: hypothetical protein ACEPOZ_07515 [Marinifilaceae bacterium]
MEQKDYILKEIDKISTLLIAMVDRLRGLKNQVAISIGNEFEQNNEKLKRETGFDLDILLETQKSDFERLFRREEGWDASNLELLADLISNVELENKVKELQIRRKAMELYEYLNQVSQTFSMDRDRKITGLKVYLESKD